MNGLLFVLATRIRRFTGLSARRASIVEAERLSGEADFMLMRFGQTGASSDLASAIDAARLAAGGPYERRPVHRFPESIAG